MTIDLLILGPVLTLIIVVLLAIVVLKFGHLIWWLIINSLIGLLLLTIINFIPFINITVDTWSILIVALGGIPGLLLLALLSGLGIAF